VLERRREAERRHAEEAARVTTLKANVAAWIEARNIRAFVEAARADSRIPNEEQDGYLDWALAQADSVDPLGPPSV
jgi:hypothetical protein